MFHSFYIYYLEVFCGEELLLLPNLFIHSLIYFYQYGFIHIYFMGYNPIRSLFCCSNCFNFGHWELPQFGSCVFWTWPHLLVNTFLFSRTTRYSVFILYFLCARAGISHFSKEPYFLWLEIPKQFEFYHNLFKIEI